MTPCDSKSRLNKRLIDFFDNTDSVIKDFYSLNSFELEEIKRRSRQLLIKNYNSQFYKNLKLTNLQKVNIGPNGKIRFKDSSVDRISFSCFYPFFEAIRLIKFPIYILFQSWVGLFRSDKFREKGKKFSVFIDSPVESFMPKEEAPERFSKFMDSGIVRDLNQEDTKLVVQVSESNKNISQKLVFTTKNPYIFVLESIYFSIQDLLFLHFEYLKVLIFILESILRNPRGGLFLREVYLFPLILVLNKKNILNHVFLCNSAFFDQEFWLNLNKNQRTYTSHMAWYSGSLGWYDFDFTENYCDSPENSLIRVDHQWVWNEQQKLWLSKIEYYKTNIHVVHPLMFYLPSSYPYVLPRVNNLVVVFDTLPVNIRFFEKVHGKGAFYYNQSLTMQRFISDICNVSNKLKLIVELKSKRLPTKNHDTEYPDLLLSLETDEMLTRTSAQENTFDLVQRASAVLAIAPTSTAHIAKYYNTPCAYYDPLSILRRDEVGNFQGVKLLKGICELEEFLSCIIS